MHIIVVDYIKIKKPIKRSKYIINFKGIESETFRKQEDENNA